MPRLVCCFCLCVPEQAALGATDITNDFFSSSFHMLPVGTATGSMPKARADRFAWISETYVDPWTEKLQLQVSRPANSHSHQPPPATRRGQTCCWRF